MNTVGNPPEKTTACVRHGIVWLLACVVSLAVLAQVNTGALLGELEDESAVLFRLASQRADQHDAHMTALSAIAIGEAESSPALFLDVAATISRFYPRIDEVQLVSLDRTRRSIGTANLPPDTGETIRAAASRSTGAPELIRHPTARNHYMIVKRSPNSDAAIYALALGIDAERLLVSDTPYWTRSNVAARLIMPDGEAVAGQRDLSSAEFSKVLGSASQPLRLETHLQIGLGDRLPPLQSAGVVLAVTLVYLAVFAALRQMALTRKAEAEARLRQMETQLVHASRVNTLGEMASGMAHELTQPLTAILAQARTAQHLMKRGDMDGVNGILDDTVTQTKRASAILDRLRNWSMPRRAPIKRIDLRDVLANVRTLLSAEAERYGVELIIEVPDTPVAVMADQVEMEQVLHNLLRNALSAASGIQDARAMVRVTRVGEGVTVEVSDNGPGVSKEIEERLFTPFVTTREDGTGLGLALSQRLVERVGGEIAYVPGATGAVFRVTLPTAADTAEAAQ